MDYEGTYTHMMSEDTNVDLITLSTQTKSTTLLDTDEIPA